MSFFDKVKKTAADAAEKVQTEVQETKLKNELVRTYEDLGRKTFELVDKGDLKNTTLNPLVKHIKDLKKEIEALERAGWDKKT